MRIWIRRYTVVWIFRIWIQKFWIQSRYWNFKIKNLMSLKMFCSVYKFWFRVEKRKMDNLSFNKNWILRWYFLGKVSWRIRIHKSWKPDPDPWKFNGNAVLQKIWKFEIKLSKVVHHVSTESYKSAVLSIKRSVCYSCILL